MEFGALPASMHGTSALVTVAEDLSFSAATSTYLEKASTHTSTHSLPSSALGIFMRSTTHTLPGLSATMWPAMACFFLDFLSYWHTGQYFWYLRMSASIPGQ